MRILIGGDVVPTASSAPLFESGDVPALFGTVPALFAGADRVIVNLECALTESEGAIRKCGPNLKARPVCAHTLRAAGVTNVALSNNHVLDFGQAGLRDTLAALDAAGLPYTGVGENETDARRAHIMDVGDRRVALLAVAEHEYSYALPDRPGVWGFDPFDTMEDIQTARENADYVVVLYHGGKEQSPYPSPRLRKACRAMVRAGACAVLCQHSHCIGTYEKYRCGHILYGQGNFHFVKYADHPHWQSGLLAELELDKKVQIRFHPVVVRDAGVTLAEGAEKEAILADFHARSAVLRDTEAWLAQWHAFCESVAPQYRRAVAAAFANAASFENNETMSPAEIFPHYLDCEAHTDVWHELFPTWHRAKTSEPSGE